MRARTVVAALVVAAPLIALESTPAAAFGWCGWGWGSGYTAPRAYGYTPRYRYSYAPRYRYYGGAVYGRRSVWRGYGARRSYAFRTYGSRVVGRGIRGSRLP
jgi:hypothetical protein